ncbi:PHP domain-containing protein [Fictibacillus sp. Mic-4]|uniref:PHP domain-containing protein n=1 Tax=Fictibacillus sp. Mic-4 TaxID=3132826 RepID=UPI003CEF6C93
MTMEIADLHTHTTASDGMNSPGENVKMAVEKGLKAIAITDHDTASGIEEALAEAKKHPGFECVPGIEISTLYNGQDIHVLGYYINHLDQSFLSKLDQLRNVRNERNHMIIEKLNKLGIPITLDEVAEKRKAKEGNIGRPHIAEVLMEKGIVSSLKEAFDVYLGKGKLAYATPKRISPEEAVKMIIKAGGVPVLAHPGLYDEDELIPQLVNVGLQGLEVYHSDHSDEQEEHYKKLADNYRLLPTAGSDFHGIRNGVVFHGDIGNRTISFEAVLRLKELAKSP